MVMLKYRPYGFHSDNHDVTGLSGKHLSGKKIVLGISGGIAAYNPELVRRLRDRGAEVRVVMTHAAKRSLRHLYAAGSLGLPRL